MKCVLETQILPQSISQAMDVIKISANMHDGGRDAFFLLLNLVFVRLGQQLTPCHGW